MPIHDISKLLTDVRSLIDSMHCVRDAFSLLPKKEHIATCINYSDLIEMREEFVSELFNTVVPFVYSTAQQERTLVSLGARRGTAGAWTALLARSIKKFRRDDIHGQFSEILLCALLQHYFHATPLVRKMRITTNTNVERHGADAIHIANAGDGYELFLGEAKTYDRKHGLTAALRDASFDAVTKHFPNHRNELDLYLYEDFLPPELEQVARDYKNGTLTHIRVNLVCIVTYDIRAEARGNTRDEILDNIVSSVRAELQRSRLDTHFNSLNQAVLPRLNYIIFPVRELDNLVATFASRFGGTNA